MRYQIEQDNGPFIAVRLPYLTGPPLHEGGQPRMDHVGWIHFDEGAGGEPYFITCDGEPLSEDRLMAVAVLLRTYKAEGAPELKIHQPEQGEIELPEIETNIVDAPATRRVTALKVWNGPPPDRMGTLHLHVCAKSQRQAVEMLQRAGFAHMTLHELRAYWSPCWGKVMEDVVREPGVWSTVSGGLKRSPHKKIL